MKSIVFLTKDILMRGYLPTYGNKYWKTPNIDELVAKGTVFERHYAAAPSTVMSFLSMVTGKYPYEFDRKTYKHEEEYTGHTIFDTAKENGLESHLVWSDNYMKFALPFANCFKGAEIHTLDMNQPVGPHLTDEADLVRNEEKAEDTLSRLFEVIDSIPVENVFLWIHLPHVILGRIGYGDDIDLLDRIVGHLRERYGDDSIHISADHGNMNGEKGLLAYGFHVYDPSTRIPFITPRINGLDRVKFVTSNTQLSELLFEKTLSERDYVLSESTYYLQPNRKTAVICGKYKLIRNKLDGSEEMYDVDYDPTEERNLLTKIVLDKERRRETVLKEVYFYPDIENTDSVYEKLKAIMDSVWRMGTPKEEKKARRKYWIIQNILPKIAKLKKKKKKKKVYRK